MTRNMKVIILAREADSHAAPVKWGLEQAGYQTACWSGPGWTEDQQAAIFLDREIEIALGPHPLDPGDVLWFRRPQPANLHPQLCEADKAFAEEEYRWFHYSLAYLPERLSITCINPYTSSRLINNKSVQLQLAGTCGFNVPRAVMCNSPAALKSFLQKNRGRTICKAFFPHVWKKEASNGMAVTEAFEISPTKLPADHVLTFAPAIYQEMVVKQFDVRTVLMGASVYSFALHDLQGALDWRQNAWQGKVKVKDIETPVEVKAALTAFAQKSGIVFGVFDFAVDMQGQWWFLEVNEEGQFLWLEELLPSAKLMQRFLAFLTSSAEPSQSLEERTVHFPALADYLRSTAKQDLRSSDPANAKLVSTER